MARSHGERLKTRHKFNKDLRSRGFSPVSHAVQDFEVGQKVHIDIDPSVHKGMPYRRFQGITGEIMGQKGRAWIVSINDGGKKKTVIARSQHLKPQKNTASAA